MLKASLQLPAFKRQLLRLASDVRAVLGLSLFGVDVILPGLEAAADVRVKPARVGLAESVQMFVVDANYLPSYRELATAPSNGRGSILCRDLCELLAERCSGAEDEARGGNPFGIISLHKMPEALLWLSIWAQRAWGDHRWRCPNVSTTGSLARRVARVRRCAGACKHGSCGVPAVLGAVADATLSPVKLHMGTELEPLFTKPIIPSLGPGVRTTVISALRETLDPKVADRAFDSAALEQRRGDLDPTILHTAQASASGPPAPQILLGYALLVQDDLPSRPGLGPWLSELYVRSDRRRRGVGSALVRDAARAALQAGARSLFTLIREGDEDSLCLFFERLGWRILEKDVSGADAGTQCGTLTIMTVGLV
jgi:GNAT superfamily N-acetyltransferase